MQNKQKIPFKLVFITLKLKKCQAFYPALFASYPKLSATANAATDAHKIAHPLVTYTWQCEEQ